MPRCARSGLPRFSNLFRGKYPGRISEVKKRPRSKLRETDSAVEKALPRMKRKFDNFERGSRWFFAALVISMLPTGMALAANEPNAIVVEQARGGEPGGVHVAKDFTGSVNTRENLLLKLNADLGSVRILVLEKGAAPMVRYKVHVETDARGAQASQLLEHYALSANNSGTGVEIKGNLPQQLNRGANAAQFWVHFEVYVPASYGLDVNTGAGDIQTSDVGGTASLVTEGGNIVAGRMATNYARGGNKGSAARVVVKLQTEGGHIQVADVSGDLKTFTAGGNIYTGYL